MKRTIPLLLAVVLVTAACGDDDAGTDPTSPTTTGAPTTTAAPDPDRLVLRITDEGGFAPIEFLVNRMPRYSLYADGTLLYEGPQPAVFPGPMLPSVLSVRLSEDKMDDVMVLVEAIGLPSIDNVIDTTNANRVADASTTVVTYRDAGGVDHVYGVYALGLVEGATDEMLNLGSLIGLLDGYTGGGGAVGETFIPDRLQVFLGEGPMFEPEFTETLPWPLDVTPGGFADEGLLLRCTVVEGPGAAEAYDVFSTATRGVVWDFEGTEHVLLARPLLPDEAGCTST